MGKEKEEERIKLDMPSPQGEVPPQTDITSGSSGLVDPDRNDSPPPVSGSPTSAAVQPEKPGAIQVAPVNVSTAAEVPSQTDTVPAPVATIPDSGEAVPAEPSSSAAPPSQPTVSGAQQESLTPEVKKRVDRYADLGVEMYLLERQGVDKNSEEYKLLGQQREQLAQEIKSSGSSSEALDKAVKEGYKDSRVRKIANYLENIKGIGQVQYDLQEVADTAKKAAKYFGQVAAGQAVPTAPQQLGYTSESPYEIRVSEAAASAETVPGAPASDYGPLPDSPQAMAKEWLRVSQELRIHEIGTRGHESAMKERANILNKIKTSGRVEEVVASLPDEGQRSNLKVALQDFPQVMAAEWVRVNQELQEAQYDHERFQAAMKEKANILERIKASDRKEVVLAVLSVENKRPDLKAALEVELGMVPAAQEGLPLEEYNRISRAAAFGVGGAGAETPPIPTEQAKAATSAQAQPPGTTKPPAKIPLYMITMERIKGFFDPDKQGKDPATEISRFVSEFKSGVDPQRQAKLRGRLSIPKGGINFADKDAIKQAANEAIANKFGIEVSTEKELKEKLGIQGIQDQEFLAMQQFVAARYMLGLTDTVDVNNLNQAQIQKYLAEIEAEEQLYREALGKENRDQDPFQLKADPTKPEKLVEDLRKMAAPVPGHKGLYMHVDANGNPQFVITEFNEENFERTVHGLRHSPVVNWKNIPKEHRAMAEATSLRAWKTTKFDGEETPLSQAMPKDDPGNYAKWLKTLEGVPKNMPGWTGAGPEGEQKKLLANVVDANKKAQQELADSLLASNDPKLVADTYQKMSPEQRDVLLATAQRDYEENPDNQNNGMNQLLRAAAAAEDPTVVGDIYARIKDGKTRYDFAAAAKSYPNIGPQKVGQSRSPGLIIDSVSANLDPQAPNVQAAKDTIKAIGNDGDTLAKICVELAKRKDPKMMPEFYNQFVINGQDKALNAGLEKMEKSKDPNQQAAATAAREQLERAKQQLQQAALKQQQQQGQPGTPRGALVE